MAALRWRCDTLARTRMRHAPLHALECAKLLCLCPIPVAPNLTYCAVLLLLQAFVGFCLQSNGIIFPWNLTGDISFADIAAAGGPAAQWDALPTNAKLQIIGFVGFLEWWGENAYALAQSGEKHYMRGGKPGFFPSFNKGGIPHPVPLELYDPFGFNKGASEEKKAKSLVAEINNGRLAMIGIMGLCSASKGLIVPGLDGLGITPYSGEYMAPLTSSDSLPFVADMLKFSL